MKSEEAVKSEVRLAASKQKIHLWRNNVGVMVNKFGVPTRYGLCNESKQMNEQLKSSDFIGIKEVVITQDMVGQTFGQFIAIETKKEGWKFTGNAREIAQMNYILLVQSLGGYGAFISDAEDL